MLEILLIALNVSSIHRGWLQLLGSSLFTFADKSEPERSWSEYKVDSRVFCLVTRPLYCVIKYDISWD